MPGGVCGVSLTNGQGDEQVELWPKWNLEAGTNQLYLCRKGGDPISTSQETVLNPNLPQKQPVQLASIYFSFFSDVNLFLFN